MRFVHTADWQIGLKAAHAGLAAGRVRTARVESARAVIELARALAVDFILIAGDTFEDNGVSRRTVEDVAGLLFGAPCPVFLIPGNHDAAGTGSVWEQSRWRGGAVHVLTRPEAVEVPGGTLYPCPLFDRWSNSDPTAWIPREDTGAIRIGMAHGTVAGLPDPERSHPIARDAAARAGLDYLALGHWHSTSIMDRMAYCGTHEPSRFGERNSGQVLLVEIAAPGAEPEIRPIPTGRLRWVRRDEVIRSPGRLEWLLADLENEVNGRETLLECRLSGWLAAGDRGLLEKIERVVQNKFLLGRLDRSGLVPAPDDDGWVEQMPVGYLREAASRLRDRQDEAGAHALLVLYELL